LSTNQELSLFEKIRSIDEKSFQYLAVNFFRKEKYLTYLTHGPLEHGADALMLFEARDDFLGRGLFPNEERQHNARRVA
jgi:hypothetical protein